MKKNKINLKPIIFMFFLPVITAIGFTMAYYTSEVKVVNDFKANTYNVDIEDRNTGSWGERTIKFINKEETNTPVVIRINYNESWTKKESNYLLTLDNTINQESTTIKTWTEEFLNDFTKGEDGWYYYNKKLNPKESVQVLNNVDLNTDLIKTSPYYNDYLEYTYDLSFNFEAIQATPNAIKELWNIKTEIKGNEVIWQL